MQVGHPQAEVVRFSIGTGLNVDSTGIGPRDVGK